jgi:hypothetical protein
MITIKIELVAQIVNDGQGLMSCSVNAEGDDNIHRAETHVSHLIKDAILSTVSTFCEENGGAMHVGKKTEEEHLLAKLRARINGDE